MLGNYVPVNYHCLYDLSATIGCILRAGNGAPLNINAMQSKSIKTYLNLSLYSVATEFELIEADLKLGLHLHDLNL